MKNFFIKEEFSFFVLLYTCLLYTSVPDRILHFTEILVQDYLSQEMCDNRPPRGAYDLFARCV